MFHSISTFHYCLSPPTKKFCGERENCTAEVKRHETKKASQHMSDAFYGTIWFPKPETAHTATAMLRLSLSCREARQVLVRSYPRTLRVYQESWSKGVKSRLVRCNPATDILVITSIGEEKLVFPYETMPGSDWFYKKGLRRQKEEYPHDAKLFAELRDLISSWENVAYYYSGLPPLVTDPPRYHYRTRTWSPNVDLIEGDPMDFEPFEDANPRPSETLPSNVMFLEFVPYLQSLKRLIAWPHPKYWPELRKDAIVIDDVRKISFPEGTKMPKYVEFLIKDANSFVKYYSRDTKIHNALFLDSDEHWAVKAKRVTRVGSFVAPFWVAGSDDTEGPAKDEFGDEYGDGDGDEDDDGGEDDDGDEDEGSEDYSEEDEEGEDDYSDTGGEGEGSDEDFSGDE